MNILNDIRKPVESELDIFEKHFHNNLKSDVPFLNIILNYIIRTKGKRIRPLLTFLSAKIFGEINSSTYTAATFIELLHTATLIHDDIVDESFERRGKFSINAIWKSKVAVLVGDYFLSRGLLLAVKEEQYNMLETISEAVKAMSEGELIQMQSAYKSNIDIEKYFEIIDKKTASLFKACVVCGAQSVGVSEEDFQKISLFGSIIGIAFQIKDDIFDYENKGIIGKPIKNDIKDKKLTLPLILALNNSTYSSKKEIIRLINNHNNNKVKVQYIIDFVKSNKGIELSYDYLNNYKNKAFSILDTLPSNEANTSMKKLVEYIISRKS